MNRIEAMLEDSLFTITTARETNAIQETTRGRGWFLVFSGSPDGKLPLYNL